MMGLIVRFILFFVAVVIFSGDIKGTAYVPLVGHPRLLLHEGEEKNVIGVVSSMPEIKNLHDSILRVCDRVVKWSVLERKVIGGRMLDISREALRRIFYLSYGYRMTGNKKYADRAIREMLNVCGYVDWHPDHFLDVGEMSMGVALGYDWLYDLISEEDKAKIVAAINEKAFQPALHSKNSYFYRRANNWNSVCNAGLLYGAIAVLDDLPKEAYEIIERCIASNPLVLKTYGPDGGYPEGYGYWSYGTTSEVLLIDALLGTFGTEFGLTSTPGFKETGKFIQYMAAPSGQCFNFSDSWTTCYGNMATWWLAGYNGDMSLLYQELKFLRPDNIRLGELRLLPALPIFASRLKEIRPTPYGDRCWISHGVTPVFIYRGGWDSVDDTYLGVKGGCALTAHAHMDAGAFVYEYDGVRWATDLGRQDYNSLESKGVKIWDNKQDGQRWEVLCMRNEYHNTLTLDEGRHNVDARAEILSWFDSPQRKGAIVDLTSTLGNVSRAHREVSVDENDYLTVIDSVETGDREVRLRWVMVTPANAEMDKGKSIVLMKGGKRMRMSVDGSHKVTLGIWPTTPLHSYDKSNDDTVRVGYEVAIPANQSVVLTVKLVPDHMP